MKKEYILLLFLLLITPCLSDTYTSHQKPNTDSALDIGDSSLLWRYVYADSFTDGTALWYGSGLSGFETISGTTLTDGIFSVSGGIITAGTWQGSTITVPYGGTGAITLTDGGLLLGSGSSPVTAMSVLADGSIIVGDGATDPVALAAFTSSTGDLKHEAGGLEADVSGYADGLYGMASGATVDIDTSSEVAAAISDETGTGALVFGTSPTLTTSASLSDGFRLGDTSEPNIVFDETNDDLEFYGGDRTFVQNKTDSTTGFQVLDADGGTPVFNVDSTNERVGIKTSATPYTLTIGGTGLVAQLGSGTTAIALGGIGDEEANAFIGGYWTGGIPSVYVSSNVYWNGAQYIEPDTDQSTAFWETQGGKHFWWTGVSSYGTLKMCISVAGHLGLGGGTTGSNGEQNAETVLEITDDEPYITLHSRTHEDTDGGRESRLNFKGEQSGGEETTLAKIEASHTGASDDQKGQVRGYINDGDDGDSPTQVYEWDSVGLEFVNSTITYDVNNVSADLTSFETYGLHIIDSSGAGITGTLAAGTKLGQSVKFVCKVAGNDIDITVSNHVTSDPEVIRLDTAKEWVELVWDDTDWVEVDGSGQSYP